MGNDFNDADFDFDSEWESFSSSPTSNSSQNNGDNYDDIFGDEYQDNSSSNEGNFIDTSAPDTFSEFSGGNNYFNFGDEEVANANGYENNNQQNNDLDINNNIDSDVNDYWANQQNQFAQQPMQNQGMQGQPMQNQGMQGQGIQNQGMQGQGIPNPIQNPYMQNQQIPNPMQDQQGGTFNNLLRNLPTESNLGYKGVGIVIVVALIIISIIIVAFIRIRPKQRVNNQNTTTYNTTQNTQQNNQTQQSQSTATNGLSLIEIPSSTKMNIGDTLTGQGTVTGFNRFLVDNQVVYCIYLNVDGKSAKYFCTKNAYGNVTDGDALIVTYRLIDNRYISIEEISKG